MGSARQWEKVLGEGSAEAGLPGQLAVERCCDHSSTDACDGLGAGAAQAERAGSGFSPGNAPGWAWTGRWLLPAGLAAACSAFSPI